MSKNDQTKNKYNRFARFYNFFTGNKEINEVSNWAQRVLDQIEGSKLLEIGVGTGKLTVHYPETVDVIGIDFSTNMLKRAQKATQHMDNVILMEMDAEQLTFKDNSFDTVVASCVFCAVPDPIQGISELRRVCKPGGKIIMVEHVRSNKKVLGKLMDWLNVITVAIMGEHINRDTENNVLLAGFNREDVKSEYLFGDIVKFIEIRNNK